MFEPAVSDKANLERLNLGVISHADYYFARFLASRCDVRDPKLISLFADLSHALTEQHSCLNLALYANSEQLIEALKNTDCVSGPHEKVDGSFHSTTPLVLENNLLFLQKYFQYECRIATRLLSQNIPYSDFDDKELTRQIYTYFPDIGKTDIANETSTELDWQMIAAFQALTNRLTIITGGPGTGKTTTVSKILDIWSAMQNTEISPGDIRLAAPTGKAAMRLSQSLAQSNNSLEKSVIEKKAIEPVVTVHRLLGYRPQDNSYRHNGENQLRVKLLIVDEVSMLDLAMLDRLLKAVPVDCQLVLIGDPNQLPSVETGNALMDICNHPAPYSETFALRVKTIFDLSLPYEDTIHGLSNAICRLVKSHRFTDSAGVGKAANAILNGQSIEPDDLITLKNPAMLTQDLSPLLEKLNPYIDAISNPDIGPLELLDLFETTRILCPVREGPLGVEAVNLSIEQTIKKRAHQLSISTGSQDLLNRDNYYHGRPVMILRNDYGLSLFNGDIGICIANSDTTAQGVAFKNVQGEIEIFPLSRLPQHETCFAMTIHKAQGSEFNHVSLILGMDLSHSQENLITRELLYTAVTRSRQSVTIYSEPSALEKALQQRIQRSSGLSNRLLTSAHQANDR